MIDRRRLVTPQNHLDLVFEPAGAVVLERLRRARDATPPDVAIAGVPAGALRAALQRRLGLRAPLVVTGHQAELFHAGVLAKSIAAAVLAERAGGTALFLLVDSDTPKTRCVWTPRATPHGLERHGVALPGVELGAPLEVQPGAPAAAWQACFDEIASTTAAPRSALWDAFTRGWVRGHEAAGAGPLDFTAALGNALHAGESALGLRPLQQSRVSELAGTPEFATFALHLLQNAEAVAHAYNAAQASYRRRHRIRHPLRPVPPLGITATRVETPFWVLTPQRRRERLWVGSGVDARLGFAGEPAREPCLVVAGSKRAAEGAPGTATTEALDALTNLRPRALTLTAFARLLLADVFIHGIGGAKYDEITDEFVTAFFGVAPAPIACVTATLHLPLDVPTVDPRTAAEVRRRIRDLRFNPQRYAADAPRELVAARATAIAHAERLRREAPGDRRARRAAWKDIQRLNQALAAEAAEATTELERTRVAIDERLTQARVAHDREYCFALHPLESVAALVARIGAALELRV